MYLRLLLRGDPGAKENVLDEAGGPFAHGKVRVRKGFRCGKRCEPAVRSIVFLVMNCLLTILMHVVPHASDVGLDPIKAAGGRMGKHARVSSDGLSGRQCRH